MGISENKDRNLAQQKKPVHWECGSTRVWNARATHISELKNIKNGYSNKKLKLNHP